MAARVRPPGFYRASVLMLGAVGFSALLTWIVRTSTGHATYAGAYLLNGSHQGIGNQHGPEHSISELCADLRVSGDTTWVIVGRAGYKSGTQFSKGGSNSGWPRGATPMFKDDVCVDRIPSGVTCPGRIFADSCHNQKRWAPCPPWTFDQVPYHLLVAPDRAEDG